MSTRATPHHDRHLGEQAEVVERVAGHGDQVGVPAGGERADPVLEAEQLGRDHGRTRDHDRRAARDR